MNEKIRLTTKDIALISTFSALWIALNFTVAPIGFSLFGTPLVHSAIIFLTLLLTTWATGKIGTAASVGIIGSTIVLLAGGPIPTIGFAAASLIYDAILTINHHKLNTKPTNIATTITATIASGYFAGLINGIFILNQPLQFAATIWATWTLIGAVIGTAITLPVIAALEKANVKKIQNA
jgi:hypothetical protein